MAALRYILICTLSVMVLGSLLTSCGNTRSLVYMQGKFDTAKYSQVPLADPAIRKGDLVSIIVYSDNPEATRIYNQTLISGATSGVSASENGGVTSAAGGSLTSPGYLVDENGNIEFQGIGLLHIDGLTRGVLKDTLNARLKPFLSNPYFAIRFLNFRFTMLGEVAKPGIYTIPGDRVNILQALGLAGDMTFYGRRDNVLVVRETDGKREFARLDLTKPDILGSPYFYLQQNDVVVFEPNNKKIAANDQVTLRNISIAATVVSTFAIIYSIFKK